MGWDKQALHVSWAHTGEIDLGFREGVGGTARITCVVVAR